MFCDKCGQEVKENCRFCPNCGNEIQKEVKKKTYKNLRRGIFGIISILFVMTAVMVGKSIVGKSIEEKIAGDWKLTAKDGDEVKYDYELKFWDDGKFMVTKGDDDYAGVYNISEDSIRLTDANTDYNGEYKLDGDTIILYDYGCNYAEFERQ